MYATCVSATLCRIIICMIRNWAAGVAAAAVATAAMVLSPASAAAATPPVHAGTEIRVGNQICTLGYVLPGPDGKAEGVTAGHCGVVGDSVTDKNGTYLGYIADSLNDYNGDIARIRFNDLPGGSLTTWVPYQGKMLPVLGSMTFADVMQAQPVLCKVGRTTGESCGPLQGAPGKAQVAFAAASDHGDSGGPVYALSSDGVYAVGILFSGSGNSEALSGATGIAQFAEQWGLTVASP